MALKKAPKKGRKLASPVSFRFTPEAKKKLEQLAQNLNLGQTEILESLIDLEHSAQEKKGLFKK